MVSGKIAPPPGGSLAIHGQPEQAIDAGQAMRRYLLAVILGAMLASFSFLGLLGALQFKGILPPPGIANSECVDEKLAFLRRNNPRNPNLLVIGSSVAWRHFDGSIAVKTSPGTAPLNGGFCGLSTNQIAFTAHWLLERVPSIKQVIMITAPQDFESCKDSPEVFNADSADRFVFRNASKWPFYFHYFDPVSLIRNVKIAIDRKADKPTPNPMIFTQYGDGPLYVGHANGLVYGKLDRLDPGCFEALRAMALAFRAQHRSFMVVMTPINPAWQSLYDSDRRLMKSFGTDLGKTLNGTNAQLWNADADAGLQQAAFTDAIHLRWSAVGPLSQMIMQRLHPANPAPAPATPN